MESIEFVVQFVIFFGVEQQVCINSLLIQFVESLGGGQLGQLLIWIGCEVWMMVLVWFQDVLVMFEFVLVVDVDFVMLVVFDVNGCEVLCENVGIGVGEVDWCGCNVDGELLFVGFYQFCIEFLKGGEVVVIVDVVVYFKVIGVELIVIGLVLVLEGDNVVLLDEVMVVWE